MSVSLENLFKTDYSSGALEAIVLSGVPLVTSRFSEGNSQLGTFGTTNNYFGYPFSSKSRYRYVLPINFIIEPHARGAQPSA